jgi:hypothetical protein
VTKCVQTKVASSVSVLVCLFKRTKSDVCAEDSKTLQHTSVLLHEARHVAVSYPFHCLIIFPLSVEIGKSLQNFYNFLYLSLLAELGLRAELWGFRISAGARNVSFVTRSRLAPGPPNLLYNKHQKLYLGGKAAKS